MSTTGLILTFTNDLDQTRAAIAELERAGPFLLGDSRGRCQAAVLEAPDPTSAHDWHDWAARLPGVESIEVVFVHWDEDEAEVTNACR